MSMFLGPELFAEEAAAEGDESRSLLDKIIAGGGFMIPIGILSIASITLYVFNALQLSKGKFLPKRLASD
ncbi:MAG: hypothetical protein AAGJ31_14855, partial [Verrucomicrobiota bacterium]